jgi:YHS domain-containing protein
MRAVAFFVQLVFWLFVVRLVIRTLARLFFGGGSSRPRATAPRAAAPRQIEDLVLDKVCRIHVPRSRAVSARIAGVEEYFCSEACRDKARAEMARAS